MDHCPDEPCLVLPSFHMQWHSTDGLLLISIIILILSLSPLSHLFITPSTWNKADKVPSISPSPLPAAANLSAATAQNHLAAPTVLFYSASASCACLPSSQFCLPSSTLCRPLTDHHQIAIVGNGQQLWWW